jgi:3-hydroxyacyl-CoA dehydrogenase
MSQKLHVRRAAVLGAGVMGAQIAAHLVNAGVDTVLFDLPAKEGDPNGVVTKAIAGLAKLSPAPLASKSLAEAITAANYETGLEQLRDCDLIIEAIAERMDWKQDLYRKIAPFIPAHAVLASNTSGLGINTLAEVLAEELRHRFCGVHFFNPPRYMHLAELIPAKSTDPEVLEGLETFLTTTLGKGVVYAKDTPNFIGNRIGVFSILAAIHHTAAFKLGFDEVDALSGPLVGRPKSATYRTSDVVGLDTMAHVIKTMADTLPDDPWHPYFKSPAWLQALIGKGALGQKTGAGIFRKVGKDIVVLDLEKQDYRPADRAAAPEVVEILKTRNPAEKFAEAAREPASAGAVPVGDVPRPVPLQRLPPGRHRRNRARRRPGDPLGLRLVAGPVRDLAGRRLEAGGAVDRRRHRRRQGDERAHRCRTGYSTAARACTPPRAATARRRTPSCRAPPCPSTSASASPTRCWARCSHPARPCSRTTACACGPTATASPWSASRPRCTRCPTPCWTACRRRSASPSATFKGLVIWQTEGAVLRRCRPGRCAGPAAGRQVAEFEAMVANFQATSQRIKYSLVPVVAAVRGLALGGGCEFQMHSARTVAHLESYIGLVEAGVGLLPAGGGLKEIAVRASQAAGPGGDVFAELKKTFETVAMAKVSASAVEAKELGLLRATTRSCSTPTNCCTSPRQEARRWPRPATARHCRRGASRWPATSASPPSR